MNSSPEHFTREQKEKSVRIFRTFTVPDKCGLKCDALIGGHDFNLSGSLLFAKVSGLQRVCATSKASEPYLVA